MNVVATEALVVRAVPYGESDLIATLFTRDEGKVSVAVRGGRKSSRRAGGALEPFHTVAVTLEDRGREMLTLKESRVVRVRIGLTGRLDALEAAGVAMRWIRHLCPARTPELGAWSTLEALLDALDVPAAVPRSELARAGVRLLHDLGYGLELEQCVRCGKPCPPGRAAEVDAARGGLVCRGCGGAAFALDGALREVACRLARGEGAPLDPPQTEILLSLTEGAMAAHASFDDGR